VATASTSSRRRGLLLGTHSGRDAVRRIALALTALVAVTVVGTLGYVVLGFGLLDAVYQTVTTVATVGFREVQPLSAVGQVFTIVLIILGVGTVLYNLGVLVEAVTEGHVREYLWRRRMDQDIARLRDHVIVCGHGRVGRSATRQLVDTGHLVVVVDSDPARLSGVLEPHVLGDASQDDTLREAGIEHARALICALGTDAETMYATLSARALRPDLVIISRARTLDSKDKLVRAGATRAVNPQLIGGRRMASFALHADVAEFLDGVMHSEEVDHEFEQVRIPPGSAFEGKRLADIDLFREMSVPVLAVRQPHKGGFLTNPPRSTVIEAGSTLILLASTDQIAAVHRAAGTSD
jgi:voltage-gated potassium channel